jgi:tetratricopeptide (TPR) repeat protein
MTGKSDLCFFWGDLSGAHLQMHLWWREDLHKVQCQLEVDYGQGKSVWGVAQQYSLGQHLYFKLLVDEDHTASFYQDGHHLQSLSRTDMRAVPLEFRIRSMSDQTDSAIHRCSFRPLTSTERVGSLTMAANRDYQKKNYRAAITAGTEIVRLEPSNAQAHNQLAWRLATCPDASVRDGARAVTHARKACELTRSENAHILDTLAAAYAEVGQFEDAVDWQTKALLLAGQEPQKAKYRARLESYRARKPYRE